jgi:hypothetical protein
VPVVFASSGLVSVSSWQEVVDVSSIAPKLQMIITTTSLGNDPVEVYVNGNLLATLNGTEYASMVLDYSVTIENTMTIDWVALGQDIRVASVFFRQYVCLGQTTDIITVT